MPTLQTDKNCPTRTVYWPQECAAPPLAQLHRLRPRVCHQAGAKVAPPFEQHVGIDPMLSGQLRYRRAWLTRCRGQAVLELSRIIWPSFTIIRPANSVHSSSHQKVTGTTFAELGDCV